MASGVVSIAASLYEVQESDGFVDVLVTKTGNLQDAIQGTLPTLVGSAQGKEAAALYKPYYKKSVKG